MSTTRLMILVLSGLAFILQFAYALIFTGPGLEVNLDSPSEVFFSNQQEIENSNIELSIKATNIKKLIYEVVMESDGKTEEILDGTISLKKARLKRTVIKNETISLPQGKISGGEYKISIESSNPNHKLEPKILTFTYTQIGFQITELPLTTISEPQATFTVVTNNIEKLKFSVTNESNTVVNQGELSGFSQTPSQRVTVALSTDQIGEGTYKIHLTSAKPEHNSVLPKELTVDYRPYILDVIGETEFEIDRFQSLLEIPISVSVRNIERLEFQVIRIGEDGREEDNDIHSDYIPVNGIFSEQQVMTVPIRLSNEPLQRGTYEIYVTSANPEQTLSKTVTVNYSPPLDIEIMDFDKIRSEQDFVTCKEVPNNEPVQITNTFRVDDTVWTWAEIHAQTGQFRYVWYDNNGNVIWRSRPVSPGHSPFRYKGNKTYTDVGTYKVELLDNSSQSVVASRLFTITR